MENAENYINLLTELYLLKPSEVDRVRIGESQINSALSEYFWDDIRNAVNYYYTYKNDRVRPRLAQILAILEAKNVAKYKAFTGTVQKRTLPRTNIAAIADTFKKLIDVLVNCNVIPDQENRYVGTSFLVEKDGLPMLNPKQILRWKLDDAIKERPDLFVKFPYCTFFEQLAIAVQNRLIEIRVRHTAALKWLKGGNYATGN